jgi:hypothetical protein
MHAAIFGMFPFGGIVFSTVVWVNSPFLFASTLSQLTNTRCVSSKATGSAPSAWNGGGSICTFTCSLIVVFGKSLQITLQTFVHVVNLDA